jgi:hypothetical protein
MMHWRAWHEYPIDKNRIHPLLNATFQSFKVCDIAAIDWIGLGPVGSIVYKWIKNVFNFISGTDRNEFFIIEAQKAKLS